MNYFWSFLVSHNSSELLALLALAAAKSTVLLAFAALLCLSFRRFSAATRHLLWSSVICASLLLPCLSFLMVWDVPILPATQSLSNAPVSNRLAARNEWTVAPEMQLEAVSNSVGENFEIQTNTEFLEETAIATDISNLQSPSPQSAAFLLPQVLTGALAVWFAGLLLLLFRLLIGFSATNLLARRAAEFKDAAYNEMFSSLLTELNLEVKVRLLRSERTLMPVVCGVFRPSVLLPASADEWSEERLRIVLLHELTHVARRDCLTQIVAQIACAFYWFNPLVWYAARRLRIEREQACDDRVLSVGAKPSDYAHHLLEIARSMQNRSVFEWSKATTVAMARKSQFEGRLLAILNKKNEKSPMSRLMTGGVVSLMCVLFLSLALIRPTVIDANMSSSSEVEITPETNTTEKSLIDSILAINSETPNKGEASKENVPELAEKGKNKISDTDNKTLQETPKNTGKVEPNSETPLDGNNAKNVVPQPETAPEQNANTQPDLKANPFVNAKFEGEGKSEKQDKSGDFIDEMASVGFTNLSVDDLISLKTHGVTANFVRGLRALGFDNLTPRAVVNLRIHNVTPAYVEAMASVGYKGLTPKELTSARIHNVTPDFARKIQDVGYPSLSLGQLIQFRIYGITPEFVRLARSRLGDLSPKQLISLKNAGVLNESKEKDKDKK